MNDIAIQVENLSKQYHIGATQARYQTFREAIINVATSPIRRVGKLLRGQATGAAELDEIIWALKDVSFKVNRGEVLGIIGRNGAGKSTMLKVLSRITEPTKGKARIRGRVGSLLEVGTGFHPELTGRENVFLNGAILGMSREEIENKFDEIIAFAEIGKFIDTPVKHYSSGMQVRLAFAVAAHLEPEILLVDEVLAVGDASFQRKCLGKMGDVARGGRTILFVSHNMGAVNRLCERVIWIDNGQVVMSGEPQKVIGEYLTRYTNSEGQCLWPKGISNPESDELKALSISILDESDTVTSSISVHKPFALEIEYQVNSPLPYCRVGFQLTAIDGVIVFTAYDSDNEAYANRLEPGRYKARCQVPANLLNVGRYIISLNAGIPNVKNLVFLDGILTLNIEDTGAVGSHMYSKRSGIIRPDLRWKRAKV
ncbi:MAG: ABC transporter ATP-binding protein [Chloroflexi bacterium]|nr:ABC transporter ATP-binding protein [Chloroflexota bacterium]